MTFLVFVSRYVPGYFTGHKHGSRSLHPSIRVGSSVTILTFELGKEDVVGTYFISGVIRLNFIFKEAKQQIGSSVILKVPQLGICQEYGKQSFLYSKEKYIYETVIPLMYESSTYEKVVPNFYGSTEAGILVLENLKESGFYQKSNGSLLDLSTTKVALKSLAQFHALSVKHVGKVSANLDRLTYTDKGNSEWSKEIYLRLWKN